MLTCIIIDDEQFSIDALTKYIALIPRLTISASFLNPQGALDAIGDDHDIIFMDVDMPNLNGLELSRLLRSKARKLIITTAHVKYAYEAFEADADAFLLKPYTFAKFTATINRLFPPERSGDIENKDNRYFFVKNKEKDLRIERVAFIDVVAFESLQNYIKIYLTNETVIIVYLTLQDVLSLVNQHRQFIQLHRGFIISTAHIRYIETSKVIMTNGLQISVGEAFKKNFQNFLSGQLVKTKRLKT